MCLFVGWNVFNVSMGWKDPKSEQGLNQVSVCVCVCVCVLSDTKRHYMGATASDKLQIYISTARRNPVYGLPEQVLQRQSFIS